MSQQERLKIIGIGSPFGDDRLGWEVIRQLQQRLVTGPELQLIALDRPGCGLIQHLAGCRHCWLIDALQTPGAAGRYLQPRLADLTSGSEAIAGSHGFGLLESLQLAATLGQLPPDLELHCITIDKAQFSPGPLSTPVRGALETLVQQLCRRLPISGQGAPRRGKGAEKRPPSGDLELRPEGSERG